MLFWFYFCSLSRFEYKDDTLNFVVPVSMSYRTNSRDALGTILYFNNSSYEKFQQVNLVLLHGRWAVWTRS